jgi:adenylate cyclase
MYHAAMPEALSPQEVFRQTMSGGETDYLKGRQFFRRIPADPRCKACNAPFGLPGGLLSRALKRSPWSKNPRFCSRCYAFLKDHGIDGAEVPVTMLFADVRGSTGLAEELGASEFTRRINRFYRVAGAALIETDGIVDKFVGDGVVGLYVPGLSGLDHAEKAVAAARTIAPPESHGLPVGVGVHTGIAFVGALGEGGEVDDFTALGDTVNIAARLGSEAQAGEILVSAMTAGAANLQTDGLESRHLSLKGRNEPVDVVVLQPNQATDTRSA